MSGAQLPLRAATYPFEPHELVDWPRRDLERWFDALDLDRDQRAAAMAAIAAAKADEYGRPR